LNEFSRMINWENVLKKSIEFKNQKPFKFGFIEEFIDRDFYEKLYKDYPIIDDSWNMYSGLEKYQLARHWGDDSKTMKIIDDTDIIDGKWSQEWNLFKNYASSEEFIANFRKFSGIPVTRLKHFSLIRYKKGGFQLPHIHNVGPSTLIMMIYFSKNWIHGDPGGTYMASEEDESKILFEPYNLDNTLAIFHDGHKAAHGMRLITKDVDRRALQITLEGYSESDGWSGAKKKTELKTI